MTVNRGCPELHTYCKPLCGAGSNPMCEPDHRKCRIYITNHKEELPELYKLICQTQRI